jgi:hypothetical protein
MTTKILDSHLKLDETKIAVAQMQLKEDIPSEYKKFLLENNGGYPDPESFNLSLADGQKHFTIVERFLAIAPNTNDDLVKNFILYKLERPENLFPIAYDPELNEICIGTKGERKDKIYYWDRILHIGQNTDNVYLLASCFQDFLSKLS